MGEHAAGNGGAGDPRLGEIYAHEEGITMEVLTGVDLDLAYSSEKLLNLDKLLMCVWACENDLEEMALDQGKNSIDLIEKSFVFDILSGFLESEVRELDNFLGSIEEVITDACSKISIFRDSTDLFEVMEAKLHDSEDLLKQSQEQVLEIRLQSTKLAEVFFVPKHIDWNHDKATIASENCLKNTDERPKMHMVEQKRHILRMLEKSLRRELNLEKKLSEFKQNEEDLKLKQRLTEQVAFAMEEAAEGVWGRFLEAENAKEVLMGICKEMMNRVEIIQFNLNGSMRREDEAKWKLIKSTEQLKARESALQKLENSISELISDNLEVCSLREKVKLLEEQLKETDSQLKKANAKNEENEENILEMEHIIDSIKESLDIAENRADSAEAKVTELTEANTELNEELNFLKGTNDSSAKKVSLIEKQLRESEIQLQHARASSEASQEQQNMLYSAIWDMETLIEELKSKVSKAEMKGEAAEEQCILLSETNLELNEEVNLLRSRVECLETCLERVNDAKAEGAKDVGVKTELIMDMVVQLAMERERIQKQMFGLAEANKVLVEKLKEHGHKNEGAGIESFPPPKRETNSTTAMNDSTCRSFEQPVDESLDNIYASETDLGCSVSPAGNSNMVLEQDSEPATGAEEPKGRSRVYIYLPIVVLLLSFLGSYLFTEKTVAVGLSL